MPSRFVLYLTLVLLFQGMYSLKGGSFIMGSPKTQQGHFGDEGPQHEVTVSPFWMSTVEITWDLYSLFVSREWGQYQVVKSVDSEVSVDVDAVSGATTPYVEMSFGMGTDNYPAICMTQLAAVKFCHILFMVWLNCKLRK